MEQKPIEHGVGLVFWAEGGGPHAIKCLCGAAFINEKFKQTKDEFNAHFAAHVGPQTSPFVHEEAAKQGQPASGVAMRDALKETRPISFSNTEPKTQAGIDDLCKRLAGPPHWVYEMECKRCKFSVRGSDEAFVHRCLLTHVCEATT